MNLPMKSIKSLLACAAIAALSAIQIHAAPLLFEGFETYQAGALDVNYGPGPNNNPSNNPWFGPFPDNMHVTGAETNQGVLVSPHSGTNMVRGSLRATDFDQDFFNMTYWLNSTNGDTAITGSFYLDWWFYDSIGADTNNASKLRDYLALSYYSGPPVDSSYDPTVTTTGNMGGVSQRMTIGTTSNFNTNAPPVGTDVTVYQARLLGAANPTGVGYGNFWRNLPTRPRTVGWHHARWVILPQLADLSNDVIGYLDDMVNPVVQDNAPSHNGFNCIELNGNYGPDNTITAYYDDITLDVLPAPKLSVANAGANVVLTWQNGWILQSTTNLLDATTFTDVPPSDTNLVYAVSPYTNSVAGTNQLYFRLRN
jgi:hypothetical protein